MCVGGKKGDGVRWVAYEGFEEGGSWVWGESYFDRCMVSVKGVDDEVGVEEGGHGSDYIILGVNVAVREFIGA